jgi:hypothetical protein
VNVECVVLRPRVGSQAVQVVAIEVASAVAEDEWKYLGTYGDLHTKLSHSSDREPVPVTPSPLMIIVCVLHDAHDLECDDLRSVCVTRHTRQGDAVLFYNPGFRGRTFDWHLPPSKFVPRCPLSLSRRT